MVCYVAADPGVNPGRGSNVSEFTRVLSDEVLSPAIAAGVRPYLVSVSVIGEKREGTNTKVGPAGDKELDAFVVAQKSIAERFNIPFVDVRQDYLDYLAQHNCLDLAAGILTSDGVKHLDYHRHILCFHTVASGLAHKSLRIQGEVGFSEEPRWSS